MSADVAAAAVRRSSAGPPRARLTRIVRMSDDLAAGLSRAAGSAGRVHSVFARAVNLEWADGGLATLHGPGPLRAPFAATVEHVALLRAQRPGAAVAVEAGRLRLPGLTLTWEAAAGVDCAIPIPPPGLDRVVLDALRERTARPAGLDSPRGVAARAALTAAIRSDDPGALAAAAAGLLGLGEGLTPSGDDCLVGALAVLHAVGHPALVCPLHAAGHPALDRVPTGLTAIARAAAERTTAIGREFVIHALAGRFSEPVLALLRARSAREATSAVEQLAGFGATSGADTLAGLRLACLVVA